MRRKRVQPKDRRRVPIPAELRESLKEVHDLIRQAKHDPDVILDYDDAIQVGAVCGGRTGEKPRPYELTYFPDGDEERGRWYLTLHRTEIEDIGDGRMTELLMYCCTSPDCRTKSRNADDACFYCDYYDDPAFGTFEFPAAEAVLLERGLPAFSKDSTRDEVVAALGAPVRSGGGEQGGSEYRIWPWIAYDRPDFVVRFEFSKAETHIRNIAILERKDED
jgi:hypothetical protein